MHISGYTFDLTEKVKEIKENNKKVILEKKGRKVKEKKINTVDYIIQEIKNIVEKSHFTKVWLKLAEKNINTFEILNGEPEDWEEKKKEKYTSISEAKHANANDQTVYRFSFDQKLSDSYQLREMYNLLKGSIVPDAQTQYDEESKVVEELITKKYQPNLEILKDYQGCHKPWVDPLDKKELCKETKHNDIFLQNHEGKKSYMHSMTYKIEELDVNGNKIEIKKIKKEILYIRKNKDLEGVVEDMEGAIIDRLTDAKIIRDKIKEITDAKIQSGKAPHLKVPKHLESKEYFAPLATICHMIQDSYSGSHTLRNRYKKRNSLDDNMMAIVKFYDYEEQNKDPKWGVKHLYYDQFSTIIGLDKTLCYLYYQKFIKKGGLLTCGVGNKLRMAYSQKDKEYFKKKFLLALHYSLHILKIFDDIDTIIENKDSKKLEITDIFTDDNNPFELARRKDGEPESLVRAIGQQKSLTKPL